MLQDAEGSGISASDSAIQPGKEAHVPNLDPLTTPLPKAPRMRLYCGYGHRLATERAYHYRYDSFGILPEQCPAGKLEASSRVSLGQVCNVSPLA